MKLSKMSRTYDRVQGIRRLRYAHNIRKRIRLLVGTDKKWHKNNGVNFKRHIRRLHKSLKPGVVIETCGVDLAVVVKVDWENDDCLYRSLTKPVPEGYDKEWTGSCSIYNCGPEPLDVLEAKRRLDIFKREGESGLMMRYYMEDCGLTREEAQKTWDDFKKQWRTNSVDFQSLVKEE